MNLLQFQSLEGAACIATQAALFIGLLNFNQSEDLTGKLAEPELCTAGYTSHHDYITFHTAATLPAHRDYKRAAFVQLTGFSAALNTGK